VAADVAHGVLALAVLEVLGLPQDVRPARLDVRVVRVDDELDDVRKYPKCLNLTIYREF